LSVSIRNRQRRVPVPSTRLRRVAALALSATGKGAFDVHVAVVDDREIRRLNRRYLGARGPTDVLAFDLEAPPWTAGTPSAPPLRSRRGHRPSPLLGEVVICGETAARQAARVGVPAALELEMLLVHGILHLAGYDDHAPADARAMHARARAILSSSRRRALPDRLFAGLLASPLRPDPDRRVAARAGGGRGRRRPFRRRAGLAATCAR